MALTPRYTRFELATLRATIFAEEDRSKFTQAKWSGSGFRHFRDPKIVCLEHYRPNLWTACPSRSDHNKPAALKAPAFSDIQLHFTNGGMAMAFTNNDMWEFATEAWGPLGSKAADRWAEFNGRFFKGKMRLLR